MLELEGDTVSHKVLVAFGVDAAIHVGLLVWVLLFRINPFNCGEDPENHPVELMNGICKFDLLLHV